MFAKLLYSREYCKEKVIQFTLVKTEIIYAKNVGALVAMNFT